jgi:integrase/recombinase XerD
MKTREPAENPRRALAGFPSSRINDITPNPRTCDQNQRGRVSARASRLLQLYEDDLALHYGERTVVEYLAHVRAFLAWLDQKGLGLTAVKRRDLQAYQTELFALRKRDGKPYSVGFQVNRLSALKSFFGFLARRQILLADPTAGLERPRLESRLPRAILSLSEARRLVEAPDTNTPTGLRDRAILETLYATGIRATELIRLSPFDVDTEEGTLRVVRGKGGKDRNVPLTRAAAAAIEAYLAEGRPKLVRSSKASRWLFVSPRGGVIYRATLAQIVRTWARRAGIKKRVSPHVFRHSVATHLLKRGADIRHIQALLGHACLSTTERYTRVEISDLKAVVKRAHPRGR